MDEVATMFSFNNWFGHFSYLLIAISYWLTDIFWLRLVAAVGLSFEILYRGNFVGEVAFLTEKPATATVIADGNVRALVFEGAKLNQFLPQRNGSRGPDLSAPGARAC